MTMEGISELKRVPLMETCKTGLVATEALFDDFRILRETNRMKKGSGTRNLNEVVQDVQRLCVAYVPKRHRKAFKDEALAFADSVVPTHLDHPASEFAKAEMRIRKLELLCLSVNVKYGGPWAVVFQKRAAELTNAINSLNESDYKAIGDQGSP